MSGAFDAEAARAEIASLSTQACETVDVAWAFWDDGAPRTAAERLRAAADLFDQVAEKRDEAIRCATAGEAA